MSDYLPHEVMVNILARLPVKSLLRFRCVSKSIYSFISSPDFRTIHLHQSLASNSHTHSLLRHYSLTHNREHFSFRLDTNTHPNAFDEYQHLKCPLQTKRKYYFRIIGSLNGLICLSDDYFGHTNTIFLWNPSIRRFLSLPLPRVTTDLYENFMCVYGFGFDPMTEDYKVLRISYAKGDNGYVVPPEVELYKLSTHSWADRAWEEVRGDLSPFGIGERFWSQVFMNGKVHWVAYKRIDSSTFGCFIVLFDMGEEVFGEMGLPESLIYEFPLNMTVSLLGDSLSVLQYDKCVHPKHCTVWSMKEYGVVGSWSKLYAIDLQRRLVRTVGLRNNGDLLLAVGKELVTYHPENQQIKNLGVRSTSDAFYVGIYVESLALLEEGNEVLEDMADSTGKDDELERGGIEHSEYAMQFFTHRAFATNLHDL